jgi:hypothetical protein
VRPVFSRQFHDPALAPPPLRREVAIDELFEFLQTKRLRGFADSTAFRNMNEKL